MSSPAGDMRAEARANTNHNGGEPIMVKLERKSDPVGLQSGQGRDDAELREAATGFGICAIGCMVLLAAALLFGAFGCSLSTPEHRLRTIMGGVK